MEKPDALVSKLLRLGSSRDNFCLLNSNHFSDATHGLGKYSLLAGSGCEDEIICNENCLNTLSDFLKKNKGKWIFGFISYDLKNEIEKLVSENHDRIQMPVIHFFVPETVLECNGGELKFHHQNKSLKNFIDLDSAGFTELEIPDAGFKLKPRISKEEYLNKFSKIKGHIQQGDVYELTFCQEFFAEHVQINPAKVYCRLNSISPSPMSCFYKLNDKFLISSSPERFLCKKENRLFSQPVKGTIHRGKSAEEDALLKQKLYSDEKERAENIMIVDLVRNDLSKVAKRGSVKADELFGIYSFSTVHQMISTVSCELKSEIDFADIIRATFPMGSMTGAPKMRAMQLIEKYESSKRGLFSGTVGYISPDGDFDFSVIIRSLLYNEANRNLSLMVGSAITSKSEAEAEYNECILKSNAAVRSLSAMKMMTF